MTLIALKPFSIGEAVIERGEPVSGELQRSLPPRRLEALKASRLVEELTDGALLARDLAAVEQRVTSLEARVKGLSRRPGR